MRKATLAIACTLVTPLGAQQYVTSPPGFDTKLGAATSRVFGSGSYARFLMVDGEYRNKPMTLKSVSYRSDATRAIEARTWSNITLRVAGCDFDKVPSVGSVTFTTVPTTTPTTVFNGSMTWPGLGAGAPAKWVVRVPLKTPFAYTGKQDLCLDYLFAGGTLASGTVPWWKGHAIYYALDGCPFETFRSTPSTSRGRGCQDTGYAPRSGILVAARSYNRNHGDPRLWNRHAFDLTAYTGPNTIGAFAFSLAPWTTGVAIPGTTCEKLYLDFTKPVVLTVARSAPSAWSRPFSIVLPFDRRNVGVPFWTQGAWRDSRAGIMMLTMAMRSSLPELPPYYRRKCVHALDNPATAGFVQVRADHNPIARYER